MDRDEILHRVTDALCGELDGEGAALMQAALAADPVLAAEARRLERVWQRLGKVLDEGQLEQAVLTRVFYRIVERHHAELSDEELEKAAGGISSMLDGEQIKR